jgi:hypothetical protein
MGKKNTKRRFVLCVKNMEYPASLEVRMVYQALPDPGRTTHPSPRPPLVVAGSSCGQVGETQQ